MPKTPDDDPWADLRADIARSPASRMTEAELMAAAEQAKQDYRREKRERGVSPPLTLEPDREAEAADG